MSEVSDKFVNQGLRHYPDALAAVLEFRQRLAARVIGYAKSGKWDAWKPNHKKWSMVQTSRDGGYVGAGGTARVGSADEEASLEVGVWWSPPRLDTPRIFFISVNEGPEWVVKGMVFPKDLQAEGNSAGYPHLYIPDDSETPDLEKLFQRLFSAFDACVHASEAGGTKSQ